MSSTVLKVHDLVKKYANKSVVKSIDLEVQEGEILGILGHNGAGKTTSIECIQGLRQRDGGEVSIYGFDPQRQRHKVRSIIGSQLQHSELPDKLKIGEAFQLFSREHKNNIPELLNDWGLKEKEHEYFASLSGGQKQRLFIALALLNDPKIVFLDELTTGLDPFARREVWKSIKKIQRRGITVVLVSHFIDEVEALCQRIIIMKKGRIKAQGTIADIKAEYADEVIVKFRTETTDQDVSWLKKVPGMKAIKRRGRTVRLIGSQQMVVHVGSVMIAHDFVPQAMEIHQASLEEAFIKINGGHFG